MKPNFEISLPTIPGKMIKFKIQDIKQTAFGSQKNRFNENKKNLTKKFIESFNNFQESKDEIKMERETQASESGSRVIEKKKQVKPLYFRHVISEDKKHMISLYDNFKNYQPEVELDKGTKPQPRGYSFNRQVKDKTMNQSMTQANCWEQEAATIVTDNYYFTSGAMQSENEPNKQSTKEKKPIKYRQSSVFRAVPRNAVYKKIYDNQIPGPGTYQAEEALEKLKKQGKSLPKKVRDSSEDDVMDYKKLKKIITSVVGVPQQNEEEIDENMMKKQKDTKKQHMFVVDDRDRFGEQKYPISSKVNVPGPGSYEINKGIEEQSKKVALVEEQRKLLKEWFNN